MRRPDMPKDPSARDLDMRSIYAMLIRLEQKLEYLDRYLHEKLEYIDRRITVATSRR